MSNKKRNKQGSKEITKVVETKVIPTPAEIKEPEYLVATTLKDDGTRYSIGDKYKGKNIAKLLENKSITINK